MTEQVEAAKKRVLPVCECEHEEWQHWPESKDEYKLRRCSDLGCDCQLYAPANAVEEKAAPSGWWCENCQRFVIPEEVTFEETHDVRAGGCGVPVKGKEVDIKAAPSLFTEPLEKGWLGTVLADVRLITAAQSKLESMSDKQLKAFVQPDSSSIPEQTFEEWWKQHSNGLLPKGSVIEYNARAAWNAAKGSR